jgi:hypothetical protein
MVAQHKLEQQEQEGGMETTLLKKKNSIQDSVGNEENGHPFLTSTKW